MAGELAEEQRAGAQAHDDQPVEPGPRQPVKPGGNLGLDDAGLDGFAAHRSASSRRRSATSATGAAETSRRTGPCALGPHGPLGRTRRRNAWPASRPDRLCARPDRIRAGSATSSRRPRRRTGSDVRGACTTTRPDHLRPLWPLLAFALVLGAILGCMAASAVAWIATVLIPLTLLLPLALGSARRRQRRR